MHLKLALAALGATLALVVPGVALAAGPSDTLAYNHSLSAGQLLQSQNGRYRLVDQRDGNVVLYDGAKPIWATNTVDPCTNSNGGPPRGCPVPAGGNRLVMQNDGNLVLYSGSDPVWATNSENTDYSPSNSRQQYPFELIVQNDGNAVVYVAGLGGIPIWSSRTAGK